MAIDSTDKRRLVRVASRLPQGSPQRRAILSALKKAEVAFGEADFEKAQKMDGVDPSVAKYLVRSGLDDGSRRDDVVAVRPASASAGKLKPSQQTMVLEKSLGMAMAMLLGKMPLGGNLGAIISKDGHILDGHHRWAASIMAGGPGVSVGGFAADLNGKDLLKVLNIVSKGMFGVRNGKAGKGSISTFKSGNAAKVLQDMVENGTEFLSADQVKEALEKFGSVEQGIAQVAANTDKVSKAVPSWAPDRKQMPVIEPEQVPAAAKALNKGIVNWNTPYKQAAVRLASALPKGSKERRDILAMLEVSELRVPYEDELGMISGMGQKRIEKFLGRGFLMEYFKDPGFKPGIPDGPNTIIFGTAKGKLAVKVVQGGGYGAFYLLKR